MDEHAYEQRALNLQDRIATMTDKDVRQAYEATDGIPGDPWVDALAATMKERSIDD